MPKGPKRCRRCGALLELGVDGLCVDCLRGAIQAHHDLREAKEQIDLWTARWRAAVRELFKPGEG